MTRKSELHVVQVVAQLLGIMLVVFALYVARDVFIPLTLAILLSFLLSPVVNRFQSWGIQNVWAVIMTALFVFVVLAGALSFVGREVSTLVSEIPHYKAELVSKAKGLAGLGSGMGKQVNALTKEVAAAMDGATDKALNDSVTEATEGVLASESTLSPDESDAEQPFREPSHDGKTPTTPIYTVSINPQSPLLSWAGTVGTILGPLGTAGLVTVFVLFLLIYRDDMRDRIIKVISHGNFVTTTEALDEVSKRISKYLIAQTIVNVCYGFAFALGLYLIGKVFSPDGNFPNFALWGAMATLLRFVPYIGPVVAGAFPILLSLAVFPGYSVTISVIVLITVIELLSNNVLEPWLYGTSTGLSSVAIIFAAVFWAWMWGPVGLLLSTPLTVCLVVLGQYVPRFAVFSTLLGEKVDIPISVRFYQRLISGNQAKAAELLELYIRENDAMAGIDNVLSLALRRIRHDQENDRLSAKDANLIANLAEQAVAKLEWSIKEEVSPTDLENPLQSPSRIRVLGIPSHHASEELLLNTFAKANAAIEMTVAGISDLPETIALDAVSQLPDAILISVLPPGGIAQAQFLCSSIREKGYKGMIIVSCSGKVRNFDRLFVRFRKVGANFLTTSLTQSAQKLNSIKQRRDSPRGNLASQLLSPAS